MPRIARFWDALPRFGHPPSCKQPGMCSENSGLRQAISELVQRCGEALRHGFEPGPRESCAPTRSGWMPAQCKRRAALVLGESADTGRVVAIRKVADYFSGPLLGNSLTPGWRRQTRSFMADRPVQPAWNGL